MTQSEREIGMFGRTKDEVLEMICNAELRGNSKVDMAVSMLSDLQFEIEVGVDFANKEYVRKQLNVIKFILIESKR